jgi:hypothetical protein
MEAIQKLTTEIQNSAATADEAGRKEIMNALRDLQYSIEKPEDTMQRVIHLVSCPPEILIVHELTNKASSTIHHPSCAGFEDL